MVLHSRHFGALALATCLAFLLVSKSVGSVKGKQVAQEAGEQQDPLPPIKPGTRSTNKTNFTHQKHVPAAWMERDGNGKWKFDETQRDCRGCHDYGADAIRDPQTVCTQCHFSNEINEYTFTLWADPPEFTKDLTGLRSPGALFQHNYHLVLECRECHQVSADKFQAPILMPGARDRESCRTCHGGDKPRAAELLFMTHDRAGNPITEDSKAKARAVLEGDLLDTLNESPAMGANQGQDRAVKPFQHADHVLIGGREAVFSLAEMKSALAPAQAGREGNCGACHAPMFTADPAVAASTPTDIHAPFTQSDQNCGTCHASDSTGTPIQFELKPRTIKSVTAGTFSHKDHLSFVRPSGNLTERSFQTSVQGYDSIEAEGCMACHEWDALKAEGFSLKGALANTQSFQGCQSCHSTAPSDHGSWTTAKDHGTWGNCNSCHDPDSSDFATNRPMAQVNRRKPSLFTIETHSHPVITVDEGEELGASCSECHRQPVQELPSRIKDMAFSHKTHLPPEAGPESCASCHGSLLTLAEHSADLGTLLARGTEALPVPSNRLGLIYDPGACTECHLGSAPQPQFDPGSPPEGTPRDVPEFSHAGHLGKTLNGGGEVSCTTCHLPSQGSAVGTLPEALACTLCHDHSVTAITNHSPAMEGGVNAAEVAACTICHEGGLGALEQRSLLATLRVDDLLDNVAQFHQMDQDCAQCHLPTGGRLVSDVSAPTNSRLFAERAFFERTQGAPHVPAIHRGDTRKFEQDPDCFYCHWTGLLSNSLGGRTPTGDPEIPSVRRDYGNRLSDFPGGPK